MMKRTFLALALAASAAPAWAQRHELGLTLGRIFGQGRSISAPRSAALDIGPGITFQANYAYRLRELPHAALYAEIHFAAGPLQEITSADGTVTRDYATLFVTPGLRVKFEPDGRVSPYVVAGGGYGLFEQSLNQINLRPNTAPRFTHRGAFGYGGGVDVLLRRDFKWFRYVGLRGEVRDFYTGNPSFNVPVSAGGQHNVIAGGGFVVRF